MNIFEVNPYIRRGLRSVLKKPFVIEERIIFDYQLLYVESGRFILIYDNVEYKCDEGSFLLLRPGVPHKFVSFDVDLVQPYIHFDIVYDNMSENVPISFKKLDELSRYEKLLLREDIFSGYSQKPLIKVNDKKEFLKLFFEIIDSVNAPDMLLSNKAKMLRLLQMIEACNFKGAFEYEKGENDVCSEIKCFLEKNIYLSVSLEMLEKQYGYSKYHLSRIFKEKYGTTIINYHQGLRLEEAKRLLADMSATEVCEALDFGSIYAFSRAFKNHFGYAPTETKPGKTRKQKSNLPLDGLLD